MRKPDKAFTLIEVLVVIAILSLLAAILFPVFARTRTSAKNSTTLSRTSQIGKAISLYTAAYDSFYPNASSVEAKLTQCPGEIRSDLPVLQDVMKTYVGAKDTWRDPLDTGIRPMNPSDRTEPIECQLPDAQPTMFDKVGSSFVFRTDLATDHVSEPFELISEGTNQTMPQGQVVILHTAYGNWRGGPDTFSKRVVALFGDGHVKEILLLEAHQQGAFRILK